MALCLLCCGHSDIQTGTMPLNILASIPPTLDATRQSRIDLAAAYRLIHRLGLDDSIYTHISVRLPDRHDRFLINPYGLRFEEVTASNLVTVDLDGHVIDGPASPFTARSTPRGMTRSASCTRTPSPASPSLARSKGCCRSINGRCSSPTASPITTMKVSRSISMNVSAWSPTSATSSSWYCATTAC